MYLKFKLIILILAFCITNHAWADETIWKSGKNLYIKIVDQNKFKKGKTPLNEHPVELDAKDVTNALSLLEVWDKNYFKNDEIEGVFTINQQRLLGLQLSIALKKATPQQDIIFAVIGKKNTDSFFSFSGGTFTAGRVFYQGGKLNIILGDYARPRNKGDEAMAGQFGEYEITYQFSHGTRSGSKALSGFDFEERLVKAPGIENYEQGNKQRLEWFVIDIRKASDFVIARDERKNKKKESANEVLLREQAATIAKERREMRAEMARMRKEMQELNEGNGGASTESIEQRIATLDELLEKKLITQDEYDQKRQAILNEI